MIFELSVSLPCHRTGVARRVPQPQEEIAVGVLDAARTHARTLHSGEGQAQSDRRQRLKRDRTQGHATAPHATVPPDTSPRLNRQLRNVLGLTLHIWSPTRGHDTVIGHVSR